MPIGVYDHSMLKKDPSRFWDYVNKTETCWLWMKGKNTYGYGVFALHKKELYYSHRWAYELLVGPIPKKAVLDHSCHTPACVNPQHLRLANQSLNIANSNLRKDNKSGHKGVCWDTSKNSWLVQVVKDGRNVFRKHYKILGDASNAYKKNAVIHFGEFARF